MNENELFVDNPLALAGLFDRGVFLTKATKTPPDLTSGLTSDILVLLHYPDLPNLPPKAYELLGKIMTAVKWKGKNLTEDDFLVVNSGRLADGASINSIISDTSATKVILWSDLWSMDKKEIPFYKSVSEENVEMLRCHSLHTVMADPERKKACWAAIRVFFGM